MTRNPSCLRHIGDIYAAYVGRHSQIRTLSSATCAATRGSNRISVASVRNLSANRVIGDVTNVLAIRGEQTPYPWTRGPDRLSKRYGPQKSLELVAAHRFVSDYNEFREEHLPCIYARCGKICQCGLCRLRLAESD